MFRIALCLFLSSVQLLISFDGWIHLELGAGNYGQNGSCYKQRGTKKFDPNVQYKVLFWTVDELIERNGPLGVIQINDINKEFMIYTVEKLQEYAENQGYDRLIIEGCSGDYFATDFPSSISKYDRKKYDSIHLKNPEGRIYSGSGRLKNPGERRQVARKNLQKVANFSKEGLYFFTLYSSSFFPDIEKREFVDRGIFYQETDQWEAVDYYYPNGEKIPRGKVFLIQSDD